MEMLVNDFINTENMIGAAVRYDSAKVTELLEKRGVSDTLAFGKVYGGYKKLRDDYLQTYVWAA